VKDSVKSIFHKLYYSVSANFLNLVISIVVSFIVPKLLGLEQYGYWQLYLFYVGYTGFFHFGLADGIYLRYGGKYYDELDKSLMHSLYWLLTILEILIFIGIALLSLYKIEDPNKSIILIASGLNCILILPRTVLQFILQSTGRIKEYARNFIIGRVLYIVLILGFLSVGYRDFEYMLLADIIAKIVALIGLGYVCRDIVFTKGVKLSAGIHEFWINITTGGKLLFANIAGMLIIGIVRFGIERNWDVTTFGKVSFSLSISNFILTFIAAVSVVIFPIIKRSEADRLPTVYDTLGSLLSGGMLIFLIAYYPIQKILLLWLPHYYEAIQYFAILFPISMFEARTSLLINTYLKALREEKAMLIINGFSVLLSLVTTVIVTMLFKNLTAAIMSIVGLQIVKCLIPDIYLQKKMKMKLSFEVLWDALGAIVFILGNWFIGGVQGWGMYIVFVAFVGTIRRKEFINHLNLVRGFIA
jgi:O-antigen/teichoic acid export membrane protein